MFKFSQLENVLIIFIILFGILSYEFHLYYHFYFLLSFFAFFLICISVLMKPIYRQKSYDNIFYFFTFFFIVFMTLSSLVKFDFIGLSRSFLTLLTLFFVSKFIDNDYYRTNFFKIFCLFGIALSLISFLINFEFLNFWIKPYDRNSSIFFDPNFAAAIIGSSFFCILIYIKNKFLKFLMCFIVFFALFLTYSKGAIFSLIFAMLVSASRQLKVYYSVPILILISLSTFFVLNNINLDMFRAEQAFNNRDLMWKFVVNEVFIHQNFFGFGEEGLANTLVDNGLVNRSTHNAFIDVLGKYGVLSLFIYLFLFFYVLFKGFLNNDQHLSLFIFLAIMSNSITYSFGGLGFLSILVTIVLFVISKKNEVK